MTQGLIDLNAAVLSCGTVVGSKEKEGPLGDRFDLCDTENRFGQKTWEAAESEMQRLALNIALAKGECREEEIGVLFAGDLLNQCVGSSYGLLSFNIPYLGLYGACSTCAEGLLLASILVSYGVYPRGAAVTSSHFCSAERQYRTPLEYGAQRTPTAQWTVTGAGAFVVGDASRSFPTSLPVKIKRGLPGIVREKGIHDAANMGAAMAPATVDTLMRFFEESGARPADYDAIVTGDLGFEGGAILCDLMRAEGLDIREQYTDCGQLIYRRKEQDVHGGGSGCGCSATVLGAHLLPRLASGEARRILFLSTGAMMSPDSVKQGQEIPAVAHLLELESTKECGEYA